MYFLFEKLKMVEYGALLEDLFQIMLLIATQNQRSLKIKVYFFTQKDTEKQSIPGWNIHLCKLVKLSSYSYILLHL